jgi:hypothetical protein
VISVVALARARRPSLVSAVSRERYYGRRLVSVLEKGIVNGSFDNGEAFLLLPWARLIVSPTGGFLGGRL